MYQRIFLLLFVLFSIPAFGQTRKVTIGLSSKEVSCETIPKEISLMAVINGVDSLYEKQTDTACFFTFELPAVNRQYHLIVRSLGYDPLQLAFTVGEQTPGLIELGMFALPKKAGQLEEVTISGIKRSFIQVDADKTTITVKDNPILTVSSVYDAVLKIPGVVPYPGGGFAVNGEQASIYFEGVPSSLGGDDLLNLLKSLPATSVETIEIISNPGASYDANVSGAIINIITLSKVSSWFSGTLTLNYGLNQNNKALPSLLLSGRKRKYSWQMQTGYSYFERSFHSIGGRSFTTFSPAAELTTERKEQNNNGFYFFKPSINYKLNKKSNLIVNYNLALNNAHNQGFSNSSSSQIMPVVDLKSDYRTQLKSMNNEVIVKYRNRLDTLKRILDVTAYYSDFGQDRISKTLQTQNAFDNYSLIDYNLKVRRFYMRSDIEIPLKKKYFLQGGLKVSELTANSLGQYNLNNGTDAIFTNPSYNSSINFDYNESNLAAYMEAKKGFKKLSIGAGLRVEDFNLERRSSVTSNQRNNYLNLFPSANAIYKFGSAINLSGTYSRKIGVPSYSQFDPNNSGYYDSYNSSAGNPLLKPNFYDNMEAKFTVFDYMQISADYSHSQTLNLNRVSAAPNSLQTIQTFTTYHNVNVLTYFFSLPVPFGIFSQGMKFFDNPIDVDKLNFIYLFAVRTKTSVGDLVMPGVNKAMWNYGFYSQFILPWKLRMNVEYNAGTKGTYQIYQFTKPRSSAEIVLTKEFYNKKLKTSITFEDIFNQSQNTILIAYPNVNINSYTKDDTRIIWFKVSYSFGRFEKPEPEGPAIGKETPPVGDGLGR